MKNLCFSTIFMFFGVVCLANGEDVSKNKCIDNLDVSVQKQIADNKKDYSKGGNHYLFIESCTITEVRSVISNGEPVYTETILFHVDGMSCETFFNNLTAICKGLSIL